MLNFNSSFYSKFISKKIKHFHFIGIGGIGMSAIAKILFTLGYKITGSDSSSSIISNNLENKGINISYFHNKNNVKKADVVVYSAAISINNIEYQYAIEKKLFIISRSELLALIAKHYYYNIAISGSHGKTTTSSIIGKIFLDSLLDPTLVIGGIAPFIDSNVYYGKSNYFIYEACEAYGSLLNYNPQNIIITNIDIDHIDYFKSINEIISSFLHFSQQLPSNGNLIFNLDDNNLCSIFKTLNKINNIISFGIKNKNSIFRAKKIEYHSKGTNFYIYYNYENNNKYLNKKYIQKICQIKSPLFGKHNVYNVLAAYVTAVSIANINTSIIKYSIKHFINSERRLQCLYNKKNILIYSDYAHHPKEIYVTLKSLHQMKLSKKLIVIFQPHLYSRTKLFYKEFAFSFKFVNILILFPIYKGREKLIPGITSDLILNQVKKFSFPNLKCYSYNNENEFLSKKKYFIKSHTIFAFIGAGDIHQTALKFTKILNDF